MESRVPAIAPPPPATCRPVAPPTLRPPGSAFKHPPPSQPAADALKPASERLPPISSLRADSQSAQGVGGSARFPYAAKSALSPGSAVHTPQQQALMNSIAHAQSHASSFASAHQVPGMPTPSSVAMTHFSAAAAHAHSAAAAAAAVAAPHPAFAFPMGIPSFLPGAHPAFSNAQLQQMMAADGGFVAQYLNSCDPLARAALMELTRMGHYPLGKKLFGCPQCRYITDRKNNLKRHVATMHQDCDKVLECCGVVFKNKASLRDHVLIFHSNGYMCRFCGRNFCRKALLKRHLTVHSGQKDFSCDLCDYATSHKSNLERHRKVHERQGDDDDDENSADDGGSSDAAAALQSPDKSQHARSSSDGGTPTRHGVGAVGAIGAGHFAMSASALNSPSNFRSPIPGLTPPSHMNAHAHHIDFAKHFNFHASSQSFNLDSFKLNHANIVDGGAKTKSSLQTNGADSCLIDLDDEFEIGNINVVDIDV